MFSGEDEAGEVAQLAGAFKAKLSDCMEKEEDGSLKMTISIPDETFLDNMARSLARMAGAGRWWFERLENIIFLLKISLLSD